MNRKQLLVATFCLLVCTIAVLADTLTLKDGTVLQGKVIQQSDSYWIKLPSGETKTVPKSSVASFTKGDAPAVPTTPAAPTPGMSKSAGGSVVAPPVPTPLTASASFNAVKSKADRVDAPVQAVQLWEKYIDGKPTGADLTNAQAELVHWNQLSKDSAEKINGKWVGGVERKKIIKQADNLCSEGVKQLEDGQTTTAIKKFEDALKLYPQSFRGNFELGLYYLKKGAMGANGRGDVEYQQKAIAALETAAKIAPKSSSVWSNLAIGYAFKGKYQMSVQTAYKAATMHETKETVSNLVASIGDAPRGMQSQDWCKPIMENTILMAERHGISLNGGGWVYVPPVEGDEIPGSSGPPGEVWSGSGFFVTEDGYIITNHHVATGDPKEPIKPDISFRVRMDDGVEKTAELIGVCDDADIAVMKIKPDAPTTPLKISSYLPNQGSQALVLGYPATGDDEMTMQISDGTVKSTHPGDEYEVWFNLNTTHGNSGGPIVDSNDNVIAMLTAGRESFNMTITLGVGANQIKAYMEKLGDKAPKVKYAAESKDMAKFDAELLTKQARSSTVLVMAIRSQ